MLEGGYEHCHVGERNVTRVPERKGDTLQKGGRKEETRGGDGSALGLQDKINNVHIWTVCLYRLLLYLS